MELNCILSRLLSFIEICEKRYYQHLLNFDLINLNDDFFRSLRKHHLRVHLTCILISLVGRRHAKFYIYLIHN